MALHYITDSEHCRIGSRAIPIICGDSTSVVADCDFGSLCLVHLNGEF